MADEQIVTSIVAKADLSSLVAEVHRATTSLQQMQRELLASNKSIAASGKVANNLFRDTLVGSGMYASHFINLTSDVEKFGRQLDSGRLKLRDYFQTFRTHATTQKGLIRELAQEQVMLQNAVFQPLGRNAQGIMQFNALIPRGLDAIKSKTALARMEMQIMNRALSEGATSLINWGKNTQWAGRQLTVGLTVPLTMFGTAAAKAFREADQELVRLQKVYGGLSATSSTELAKVRKDVEATAKSLASSYGATFKETLSLSADIAATGKQGNELIGSIKETTRLAILGEVDRQDAMKATLAIQSAFKQNTAELAQSINFLNAVENQTSTTLADLVEAIPKAGPVIKGLGGSIKDLALYLTAMREGGINASEGANALKSGLASLINPTKVAQAKFKEFGIDLVGIVNKNAGNVTATLLELQSALDKLDPLSKQQAIEQLFGKFQFARMNALFENLGKSGSQTVEVLKLMKASAADLEGIASRELKMVTESASGKYKRALETLKADLAITGERFLDIGTKFINVFDKVLRFFEKLPEPIKKVMTYLGGFAAIIGPIIMLTGLLANFFGYITKGVVSLRAFFTGAKGWKLLTPEILATEKASRLVEKGFYSDAQAAKVLHTALTRLINDYSALSAASAKGSIPVNPTISTTAGTTVMAGALRREVDPASVYAGEQNTRAIAHMNPRDINNPATFMGGVPFSIPANRKILANPQIMMNDRLPDVPGLTTINGVSTGVVAGEAARFHALMATLGMQTEAEVSALKKTISLGGTVSNDLLQTFDDILPLTSKVADNAATASAGIVAELRAGKITLAQARSQIMALNAQLERDLIATTSAYAASKGRTIDFTKAPLMNQPVTDRNAQFTLRDLYKKEGNRQVLEEFGRLRGVRTFGAPYTIQATRIPKLNSGGSVESFGPNKTVVSGDTSINYDDRLGSVPLGGYVLNQSASMNPANQDLVAIAPYTFEDGGEITAALTPGEVVFGPKINKIPGLYDAVDAANNGYSLGGQILNNRKMYGAMNPALARALGSVVSTAGRNRVFESLIGRRGIDQGILSSFMNYSGRRSFGMNPGSFAARAHGPYAVSDKVVPANYGYFGQAQVSKYNSIQNDLARSLKVRNVNPILPNSAQEMFAEIMSKGGGAGFRNYAYMDNIMDVGKAKKYLEHFEDVFYGKAKWNAIRFGAKPSGLLSEYGKNPSELSSYLNYLLDEGMVVNSNKAGIIFNDAQALHARGMDPDKAIRIAEDAYIRAMLKEPSNDYEYYSMRMMDIEEGGILQGLKLNKGGYIGFNIGGMPGGLIRRNKSNYGNTMSLLTPEKILKVLRTSKELSGKQALGSFAGMEPTAYSHQIAPSSGRSYPIPGVSGVYKNANGDPVFFKGVPNEITAKAEVYGTRIAREVFGLDAPNQTVRTVLNPFDPTRKSKLLGLESPFDPKFAAGGTNFTEDQMIRQTIASLLMGNKDLSRGNVFGNVLADVGPAGVFSRASMNTEFATSMNSMEKQAMINLLAVRGGARKDFAYNTAPIAAGMSPRQYGSKMKKAMSAMHPKLKAFIESLPKSDRAPYIAMLSRLEEGMNVNWNKYQPIHANPAFNRGGGVVRSGRSAYGRPGNPAGRAKWEEEQRQKRARELEAQRSRAASHQIYGQQGLTTGLGRQAVRTGTTSFYNPGQVVMNQMLDPFRNSMAMKAQYIQASFAALNSSIIKGSIRLNLELINAANSIGKGYTRASTSMINGVKKHTNNLLGKASLIGSDVRQSQAMFMANAGYNVKSDLATGRPINMETGKQVSMFGPGLVSAWNQGGVYDSSGKLVEGASTRKVGTLGIRQREFLINNERLSAKEAAARGFKVQGAGGIGMGGQMGIMMGGQIASQMAMSKGQDKLGYGISIASIALMLAPLGKLTAGFKAAGNAVKGVATGVNTFKSLAPQILRLAKGFGLIGAALSIGKAIYDVKKHMDDLHQKTELTFGMTKKGAEQAGIKYFDLAEKMKLVAERQKAMQSASKGAYSSASVPGLQMSIDELKTLKESSKKNMGEFIESFNVTGSYEETLSLAKNLKAQFIAGGMSAQEASKKIYGVISASQKASDAFKVFADQGFAKINDQATAATYAVENFTYLMSGKFKGDMNAAVVQGVKTVINSFESFQQSLVGTKNSMGEVITEGEAFKMAMEKMSQISGFGTSVGSSVFKEMPLELQAISNESDSIAGILAKWKLYSSDVVYNFKEMTSTAAVALVQFNQAFQSGIDKMESGLIDGGDNTFKRVGDRIKALKKITDANSLSNQRAAAKAQRSAEDEIKLINKKIQAIEDEKNAKLEAIDAIRRKEDYQIQLQKAQLDYQDALARGDMAAAARAQLALRDIEQQRQAELAKASIEEEAKKKQDALKAQAEKIQSQQDALNRRQTAAAERSADAQAAASAITGFENRYQALLGQRNQIQFITDPKQKSAMQEQSNADLMGLFKEIQAEGSKKGLIADEIKKAFKGLVFDEKGKALKLTTTSYQGSQLTTSPNMDVFGQVGADIKAANAQADKIVIGITGGLTLAALAKAMGLNVNTGNKPSNQTTKVKKGNQLVDVPLGKDASGKQIFQEGLARIAGDAVKAGIKQNQIKTGSSFKHTFVDESGTVVKNVPIVVTRVFDNNDGYGTRVEYTKKDNFGAVTNGRKYLVSNMMNAEVYQPNVPGMGGILFEPKYPGTMKPYYGDNVKMGNASSGPVNLIQNNNIKIDKANIDAKELERILDTWSKKNAQQAATTLAAMGMSRSA